MKADKIKSDNHRSVADNQEEWDTLTTQQKAKINIGIKQADANLAESLAEVIASLRIKYCLLN
jgi:hypothetical protein